MNELCAAVMVKNEAPYLAQWVEYHIAQGFDRFIFFDNGSCLEQNPSIVLAPYGNMIETVPVPSWRRNRAPSRWALDELPLIQCKWLWAGSLDEYIHCPQGTLIELLKGYETPLIAGLTLNWLLFNSRGPDVPADRPVIERFTHACRDPNEHVKTIARQGQYLRWSEPHSVVSKPGTVSVNTLHHPQNGPFTREFVEDKAVIFHYATMSRVEYDVKMAKGRSDVAGAEDRVRDGAEEEWNARHSWPETERLELAVKGPWLREALATRYRKAATWNGQLSPNYATGCTSTRATST